MSIKYVLLEKGNPSNLGEPKKWYATAKSTGEVSLKALSKLIAQRSRTITQADTLSILKTLTQVLTEQLCEGKIIRFGDLGSFQVGIGSTGTDASEKFTPSLIKSRKVTFRPTIDLRTVLSNLTFEKA